MPELPEVEMNCLQLENHLKGRFVERVEILRGETRFLPDGQADLMVGRRVFGVWRVGKVIYVGLECGLILRSHLAMSGYWSSRQSPWTFDYVEATRKVGDESHVRVVFHLDDGTQVLYHDQRMFGRMELVTDTTMREVGNGWEYYRGEYGFNREIGEADLFLLVRSYGHRPIRTFMCDQDEVPGVGNIYSAEALFHAKIHPLRSCRSLSYEEVARIRRNLWIDFNEAILRGLSYEHLAVYRQRECIHCLTSVSSVKLDGRTVYFCSTCQR